MNEYISKEAVISNLMEQIEKYRNIAECETTEIVIKRFAEYIASFPAADVKPLSVAAEHIKQRLYETALNEPDPAASDVIADMAERIDFWIGELKGDQKNE